MPSKITYTENELKNIIDKYTSGITIRQLEKDLGIPRKRISDILKNNNIPIRTNVINSRKYYHNEHYFDNIDTEEKAYWLGFIYADGFIESKRKMCSQKFGICLSVKDKTHLEKFKAAIKSNNPIYDYIGSGYNRNGIFSKILLCSDITVNALKKHGVIENKTLIVKFPNIDQNLVNHFIRGYFDGDGSIYYVNRKYKNGCNKIGISFTGTYDMIQSIISYFGYNRKIGKKHNAYYIIFSGKNVVNKIINSLYSNSIVYLDRKRNIALEYQEKMKVRV